MAPPSLDAFPRSALILPILHCCHFGSSFGIPELSPRMALLLYCPPSPRMQPLFLLLLPTGKVCPPLLPYLDFRGSRSLYSLFPGQLTNHTTAVATCPSGQGRNEFRLPSALSLKACRCPAHLCSGFPGRGQGWGCGVLF